MKMMSWKIAYHQLGSACKGETITVSAPTFIDAVNEMTRIMQIEGSYSVIDSVVGESEKEESVLNESEYEESVLHEYAVFAVEEWHEMHKKWFRFDTYFLNKKDAETYIGHRRERHDKLGKSVKMRIVKSTTKDTAIPYDPISADLGDANSHNMNARWVQGYGRSVVCSKCGHGVFLGLCTDEEVKEALDSVRHKYAKCPQCGAEMGVKRGW